MLPGRGMNPRQMQMMMKRLGVATEELDGVVEVIIRTETEEHVFEKPEVAVVTAQGIRTYQVVGTPIVRPRSAAPAPAGAPPVPAAPAGPPEEDVALVMEQAGASRAEAIAALKAADGAPAEAIMHLLSRRGPGGG